MTEGSVVKGRIANEQKESGGIPNPAYYFYKIITSCGAIPLLASSLAIGLSVGLFVEGVDNREVHPDNEGTVMEASVMSDHKEALHKLELSRLELDGAVSANKSHAKLGDLSDEQKDEASNLLTEFSELAKLTTIDLYLKGANTNNTASEKAGAGVSEQAFGKFYSELTELTDGYQNIQDNLGMDERILIGSLDECIASSSLTNSDDVLERHQDMKEINQCMSDEFNSLRSDNHNPGSAILATIAGGFGGLIMLGMLAKAGQDAPKRISFKRRRKPSSNKH